MEHAPVRTSQVLVGEHDIDAALRCGGETLMPHRTFDAVGVFLGLEGDVDRDAACECRAALDGAPLP